MSEDGQKLLHHRRTPHSDTASDLDVGFEHVPPPLLGSTSAVEIVSFVRISTNNVMTGCRERTRLEVGVYFVNIGKYQELHPKVLNSIYLLVKKERGTLTYITKLNFLFEIISRKTIQKILSPPFSCTFLSSLSTLRFLVMIMPKQIMRIRESMI